MFYIKYTLPLSPCYIRTRHYYNHRVMWPINDFEEIRILQYALKMFFNILEEQMLFTVIIFLIRNKF